MSLLEDLQSMYDHSTTKLRLDTSKLGVLGTSLSGSLGSQQLDFDGVQSSPVESSGTISFEATTLVLNGGTPRIFFLPDTFTAVRCNIYQADPHPVLVISATMAAGWRFSDSLPWLTSTFWDDLVIKNTAGIQAQLLISTGQIKETTRGIDLSEGITFSGVLDETKGLLQWADWILSSNPRASGLITTKEDGPPALSLSLNITNTNGLASIFQDLKVPVEAQLVYQPESMDVVSGLHLAASLTWANQPVKLETVISSSIGGIIDLSLDGPLPLPAPDDLKRYFGGNSITQYIPSQFTGELKSIHVGKVTLGIGLASKQLEYARVTLTTLENTTLPIVPDWVEIGNISFLTSIFNPLSSNLSPSYRLSATLDIGGVDLLVSSNLVPTSRNPDFSVIVQLDDLDVIDLTMIAQKFRLPAGAPEIIVDEFQMGASTTGSYFIRASLVEHPIGQQQKAFVLSNLIFELDYQGGQRQITLQGVMAIAGIDAALSLSINTGWEITGIIGQEDPIDIGDLIADFTDKFGVDVPDPIKSLKLKNLKFTYSTTSGEFFFTCEGDFTIEATPVAVTVTIKITPREKAAGETEQQTYECKFGGKITIAMLEFDLIFDTTNMTSKTFIATYSHKEGDPSSISIHDLVTEISTELAAAIPSNLTIDLKDIIFAFSKSEVQSTILFGLEISADIPSLSNLPLVGKVLPADQTIKVNDLQVLIASKEIKQDVVASLNSLLPDGVTKLAGTDLSQGFNLSASITFGGTPQVLAVPVVGSVPQSTAGATTVAPAAPAGVTATDNAKWFTLQKSFGPVHFNRVGVKYQDGVASFLLDASLVVAGLTLSLDGLSFGSSLSKFEPTFDLHGLGVDYQTGTVEIGGAFLRTKGTLLDQAKTTTTYDEYDGIAIVKTEELTLSALGSYAILPTASSLFIYAVLDYPLGGPSFFFITGLAAGFGYNRSLIVPPVDQVAQFPLVTAAVNGAKPPQNTQDLATELEKLAQYIPPEVGEIFFAIGIKFTSFKIIDSFVLLTIAFGNEVEIDVLGLSTMIQPPPVPGEPVVTPVAVVQMALKASFIPAQGFLGVSAQLTSASYLLSPACHLTGGFAFYAWFAGEHTGEFVQTLGGYHPSFTVPSHYPRVPRLGYNWQVDEQLSIKGEAYFALTASVLMAGLHIQANWNSGDLQAWFNLVVDFIIGWKPFHYDAYAHADLGVSYTFTFIGTHHITFDVGADLHIWGPEFSGQAHINLDIISFDVTFGDSSAQLPSAISWYAFKQSFLPADEAVCSISVTNGLVSRQSQDASDIKVSHPGQDVLDLGVINPKYLTLVTNAVVPSNSASINNDLSVDKLYYTANGRQEVLEPFSAPSANSAQVQVISPDAQTKVIGKPAIRPMGVPFERLTSTHTITITRNGSNVEHDFAYTPILKNVPVGLWGPGSQVPLNESRFVNDALSGFEIKPAQQVTPGETAPIEGNKLQYKPTSILAAYSWTQDPLTFQPEQLDEPGRRQRISDSLAAPETIAARQQLCTAYGISADTIDLSQTTADTVASAFLFVPQVEKI